LILDLRVLTLQSSLKTADQKKAMDKITFKTVIPKLRNRGSRWHMILIWVCFKNYETMELDY